MDIYELNLDNMIRKNIGCLEGKQKMNEWLKTKGDKKLIYEIFSGKNIKSRWKYNNEKEKWCRMATPSKN